MLRTDSGRRARRTRAAFVAGMLVLGTAGALAGPAAASPPSGPAPATTNPVTLVTSQSDGLLAGQALTLTVNTSGGTTLVGGLNVHLCRHGLTNYGSSNFGYSGLSATRCVYGPGIVSGGLTGADYEQSFGPYSGSESTSGPLTFHVGTGTVTWGNVTGSGPITLDADPANPIDLVVQVNLSGDDTPTTYFVQPITFATAPDAPTAVTGTPGNTEALVSFAAPANGGLPISNYGVSCDSLDGGASSSASGAGSPILVSGLTNDKTYTCTVSATNGAGTSDASAASASFTPSAVPFPPTDLAATAGDGFVSVVLTPPSDSGATPVSSYSVSCISSDGGVSSAASGTDSPIVVPGLTNVKTYTCNATATNSIGTGLPSAASNAFIPEAVPTAPRSPVAGSGNGQATVHWLPPANSASAGVTGYVVNGFIGYWPAVHRTFNSTATTQVITGLTNGKKYTFRISAINANGTGAPSTPTAGFVVGAPSAPRALTAAAGTKQATLHFSAPLTNNGAPITGYLVSVLISGTPSYGTSFNSTSTTIVVKGLTPGKHYSFRVAATNSRGTGPPSAVSNVITPT